MIRNCPARVDVEMGWGWGTQLRQNLWPGENGRAALISAVRPERTRHDDNARLASPLKNRIILDGEKNIKIGAFVIFGIFVGILVIWHLAGGSWFNPS